MVAGGLVILALAADRFVLSAARLSKLWGVSPVLIGALIVGMGTSAPELLVSALSAWTGELDLALGNVIGSNVTNVTLVLGVTALFVPVSGNLRVLRREGMLMLAAVVGLSAVLYDLRLERWEGIVLASGMPIAALLVVRWARADKRDGLQPEASADDEDGPIQWPREVVFGLLSLGATLLGAQMLVEGGVGLASALGITSAFVGLTLVAVGTSLPELATSLAGIRRQEHDIVLGNVLGSNLFNALAVAGLAGILGPGAADESFLFASGAMVVCAVVAGLLAFTGRQLVRWEGLLLVLGFCAFVYLSY
jgi:cation:H+ antiporter